ncbi:hypothetical protein ACH61_03197 [Rathayibacter tanaceti]|uniref:Uncharacterized protein n=1 Tax=Rathayibacter tanaceti TaxID=1671680 RepID=A0A162FMR4_9MICO|nr:hypothetical protein ACH61_03197 [Rathayibacter tanaceti]
MPSASVRAPVADWPTASISEGCPPPPVRIPASIPATAPAVCPVRVTAPVGPVAEAMTAFAALHSVVPQLASTPVRAVNVSEVAVAAPALRVATCCVPAPVVCTPSLS